MQPFHQYIAQRGPVGPYNMVTPAYYENRESIAYDWPTELTVNGNTYTCTLTDSEQQKWDKYGMRPWNGHGPQIAIRDQQGIMVTFIALRLLRHRGSLREQFTDVRESDLGYVRTQSLDTRLDPEIQQKIEHEFLKLTKYAPVTIKNPFENGFETAWNTSKAYTAKKSQLEADAEERELYGGKTWQEYHDDL